MATFGGEMRFTYNGQPLTLRGAIKTMPNRFSAEKVTNQDGSVSRTLRPEAYDCEMVFEDGANLNWDTIMLSGPFNISIIEDQTNVIHQFTGANFFGRASVDRATGEVSGLTVSSAAYRKVG